MIYRLRAITSHLKELVAQFPVVVLSGARQVGKSTLLAHAFPEFERVTFDPVQDIGNAKADPELFLDNHPPPLILDEIQYAPELVSVIKRRVDLNRVPSQYILTGSQQWAVLQTANESLAGRAVFMELEGFSLGEMYESNAFWLEAYLQNPEAFLNTKLARITPKETLYELLYRGSLPEATRMPLRFLPRYFESYLATYIERDVRLLAEIEDRQLFGRFTQLLAALTAQEINHSELGRELGISYKTAQRWLRIMRDTFQWHELPAFHNNAIKRASGKSKGYFADTGLVCALQRISSPKALAGHPLTGALFESAVSAEIRKQIACMDARPGIHHWRSYGGAEVDILLERDGVFFPVEIKLNARPSKADARGIQAFRTANPHLKIAPGLIVAPTDTKSQLTQTEWVLPWDSLTAGTA